MYPELNLNQNYLDFKRFNKFYIEFYTYGILEIQVHDVLY